MLMLKRLATPECLSEHLPDLPVSATRLLQRPRVKFDLLPEAET